MVVSTIQAAAQKNCTQSEYLQKSLIENPALQNKLDEIESFARQNSAVNTTQRTNQRLGVIKIPVVFHVLYHLPEENISYLAIENMIAALNRDFRRKNNDTTNTPARFKSVAADMEFEFGLATMDPRGRGTSGIIKKYTPVRYWLSDDKMKSSAGFGDDAWDSKSYLNVWVCNMKDVIGYSTLPGFDKEKDGVVLAIENFAYTYGATYGSNDNRTLVHEVGHWLNLRHIWGDKYCGDDFIDDTPRQSIYTPGCPTGNRISCDNNPYGDMYMNYMDFTDDVCMNMFTKEQKKRARILFEPGGARHSILQSKGFNTALITAAELPDFYPKWLKPQVYPNPATNTLNIYFEYDERWFGKELEIIDMTGKVMMRKIIGSKVQAIDISRLSAGVYFIRAEMEDGKINSKFIKR
jgi:hypothetical protein